VQLDGRLTHRGRLRGAGRDRVHTGQQVGEGVGPDLVQGAGVAGGLGGPDEASLGRWFVHMAPSFTLRLSWRWSDPCAQGLLRPDDGWDAKVLDVDLRLR
jgi:hypothetical protein